VTVIFAVASVAASVSRAKVNSTGLLSGSLLTAKVGVSSKLPPRLILKRTTSSLTSSARSCSP
jgi:hypothetical protein